jgi:hypothetical protein
MRLIDADAIIVDLLDRGIEGVQTDDYAEFQQIVEDAPTVDAVPVVRCRECEHGEYDDAIEDEYCYHCRYDGFSYNKADHFCSDGERKGGDE